MSAHICAVCQQPALDLAKNADGLPVCLAHASHSFQLGYLQAAVRAYLAAAKITDAPWIAIREAELERVLEATDRRKELAQR